MSIRDIAYEVISCQGKNMEPSLKHNLRACISVSPIATPLTFFGFILCFGYVLWKDDPWILFQGGFVIRTLFMLTVCGGLTLAVFGADIEFEALKLARDEARKKYGASH